MGEVTTLYNGEMPLLQFQGIFRQMLLNAIIWMAPFLIVGVLVAFICDLVQVRWKIVTEPFKPKFSKMNPLSGIKKIFSKQSLLTCFFR